MPNILNDDFSKLEYEGWSQVANLYDQSWSNLTRQFIEPLLETAGIRKGMNVLDVACGPGYVSHQLFDQGAIVTGIDFSPAMVTLAKKLYPGIDFREGDAQQLDFPADSFDSVVMNFGMLHLAKPHEAIAEASRVLKKGGHYAFTVWAGPDRSRAAQVMYGSIQKFADMNVKMPPAPDSYMFSDEKLCKQLLTENGFDAASFHFKDHFAEWLVPSAEFLFETELNAGVRTAALLRRQSKTTLEKIRTNVIDGMQDFFDGKQYRLEFCGCIISAVKE
ncbi:MAG: class I SAM-dependent methyltransferase [Chitinophagales bacterium]